MRPSFLFGPAADDEEVTMEEVAVELAKKAGAGEPPGVKLTAEVRCCCVGVLYTCSVLRGESRTRSCRVQVVGATPVEFFIAAADLKHEGGSSQLGFVSLLHYLLRQDPVRGRTVLEVFHDGWKRLEVEHEKRKQAAAFAAQPREDQVEQLARLGEYGMRAVCLLAFGCALRCTHAR